MSTLVFSGGLNSGRPVTPPRTAQQKKGKKKFEKQTAKFCASRERYL